MLCRDQNFKIVGLLYIIYVLIRKIYKLNKIYKNLILDNNMKLYFIDVKKHIIFHEKINSMLSLYINDFENNLDTVKLFNNDNHFELNELLIDLKDLSDIIKSFTKQFFKDINKHDSDEILYSISNLY